MLLSSIALAGLATAAMAAPLPATSSPPETPRPLAVLVGQNALPNSGEVSEAIPAGNYTYLLVTKDGKETWMAIPRREVPVGAQVRYADGAIMKDFHSASLNRTFKEVMFLGRVEVAGESAAAVAPGNSAEPTLPPGHAPIPGGAAGQPDLPNVGEVSEAIPAGKYIYLHVTQDGKGTWLAILNRDIPVGARVRYADEMPMKDFYSPSLDRTFPEILFLGNVLLVED